MPIFWRYLLERYFKVFSLSLLAFVAILLVSRLSEISELVTLGCAPATLLHFVALQIPTLLTLAIPLSCLLASVALFHTLSRTCELTALRACSFSLFHLLSPVLLASFFLSTLNGFLGSEIATSCHLAARKKIHEQATSNPLALLQNAKAAQLKHAYIQMEAQNATHANHLLVALRAASGDLTIFMADTTKVRKDTLVFEKATFISSSPTHLLIENQKNAQGKAFDITQLLHKKPLKLSNDHLTASLLFTKLSLLKKTSLWTKEIQKCLSELCRRLWLFLTPFLFTLLGTTSLTGSRKESKKQTLVIIFTSTLCVLFYFVANALDSYFWVASFFLLAPLLSTFFYALHFLRSFEKGKR